MCDRMVDRLKVISDLEEQIAWIRDNDFHKFPGWGHAVLAMRDAIALLKEQEPKPPIIKENSYGWKFYYCASCGREFYQNNKFNFCEKCGQAVKWD